MDSNERHRRVRLLVKKLNKERKRQAVKIDILCNDFVAAQRDMIDKLQTITFATTFFESMIGVAKLDKLIPTTGKLIGKVISDANIVFLFHGADNLEIYKFKSKKLSGPGNLHLEQCFSQDMLQAVCKSNKLCTLDDMFAMGLQAGLSLLNKISAVALPFDTVSKSLGLLLVYRRKENKFTKKEIDILTSIIPGLSRAIRACSVAEHIKK